MTMKELPTLLIIITILNGYRCQIYYHPVQVLIPTINGTHLATNHTVYNQTNTNYRPSNPNHRPPLYPNFRPPLYPNYRPPLYPNYNQHRNSSFWANGTQDGHLLIGTIQPFDRLLFNQEIVKLKKWWTNREKIIEYPKDLPAGYSRHETITALRVYNKFMDGHGAKATIENGGIGRQFVKLKLASPFRKGLRYVVQIYGR